MLRQFFVLTVTVIACISTYTACSGDESPTPTPSIVITAPTAQSPANGATVTETTPTLTVTNASGASGLQYRFEVASNSSFSNIVASKNGLAQGTNSTTSWTIDTSLTSGTYYWRARASAFGTDSPFSATASFDVDSGFVSTTPVNNILVSDPLTNGMSVGEIGGGEFRSRGWFATDANSYIRYEIPPTTNGFVEFDVTNLRDPNPRSEKRNLMIMWDPSKGDYTENPFRVHIAKLDTKLVRFGYLRLRFISNGEETNDRHDFFDWDPNHVYHFRLEWGAFPQVVSSQRARVLMDGKEILVRNYDNLYRPDTHWVELGMGPRSESLEQAIYSNVSIGVRQP